MILEENHDDHTCVVTKAKDMGKKSCESCKASGLKDNEIVTVCHTCADKCQKTIVNNEVLAYINTYYNRSPSLQLKIAVSCHFSDADVDTAKREILKAVEEKIDIAELSKDRVNSQRRSAKEACIEDIIQIFKIMDLHLPADQCPTICAEDVSKLPPVGPEQAGNMLSVFDMLSRQQTHIQRLEESI